MQHLATITSISDKTVTLIYHYGGLDYTVMTPRFFWKKSSLSVGEELELFIGMPNQFTKG